MISKEQFIAKNFISSDLESDKLHTSDIYDILKKQGYETYTSTVGRIVKGLGIGKHIEKCNINKCVKAGFHYIKYIGEV